MWKPPEIRLSINYFETSTVADPGFPVGGGAEPLGGGADLQRGCFSVKTYAKTKELDPVGGGARRRRPPPLDPPMINMCAILFSNNVKYGTCIMKFIRDMRNILNQIIEFGIVTTGDVKKAATNEHGQRFSAKFNYLI